MSHYADDLNHRNEINKKINNGEIQPKKQYIPYTNYPTSIFKTKHDYDKIHPTQKPLALMVHLVKLYTNENQTILDFTMGSGSTGLACKLNNRNFIGIELDKKYFDIAKTRIEGDGGVEWKDYIDSEKENNKNYQQLKLF